MPTVIIPPTDVSPYTGTGNQVLSNAPTLANPVVTGTLTVATQVLSGASGGYGYLSLNNSSSLAGASIGMFGGGAGDPNLYLNALTGGTLDIRINNASKLTVSATATVLANLLETTTTNNAPFRATGATTGDSTIRLTNTGGTAMFGQENSAGNNLIVGSTGYDTVVRGPSGLAFSANAGNTLHFRIGNTGNGALFGNLAIGNTSATQNAITFERVAGNLTNKFYLYGGNTDNGYGFALYDITAAQWRWTVANNGNFLLGTTIDAGYKLDVNGTARIQSNLTTPDVILGASGPSVKSSLDARAPRQGLVQDGTSGSSVAFPAFGTADFAFFTWIKISDYAGINGIVSGANGSFALYVSDSSGLLNVDKRGIVGVGTSSSAVPTNKFVSVGYTRSGTTGTFYINGVAAGTVTDNQNYSVANQFYGSINPLTQNPLRGTLLSPFVYNRALSAAEVVALFEAGAPAASDYQPSFGNPININTPSLFLGSGATGSLTASTTTSYTLDYTGGSTVDYRPAVVYYGSNTIKNGSYWRVRFTTVVNAGSPKFRSYGDAPWANAVGTIVSGTSPSGQSLSGTQNWDYVVQASASQTNAPLQFTWDGQNAGGAAWNVSVSGISVEPLGLLLAPETTQPGSGFVWTDLSGNTAQILLPTTGVSWNVPGTSSTRIRGTTSTNGNEKLLGATALLYNNAALLRIRAKPRTGTPTVEVGVVSGNNALVDSVTLTAASWNVLTIKAPTIDGNYAIWVKSNSTDVIEWDFEVEPLFVPFS